MELGENQITGRYESKHSMNISRYLHIPPAKGEALHGQPAPQVRTNSFFTNYVQTDIIAAVFPSLVSRVVPPVLRSGPEARRLGGAVVYERSGQEEDSVLL